MERRSFIQTLAAAGFASPLSTYLLQAKPIDPSEGMLIDVAFHVGDQVLILFPENALEGWFVLILKPNGQRIKLKPGAEFRQFYINCDTKGAGVSKEDADGNQWRIYKRGEMRFGFDYRGKHVHTVRLEETDPARFRVVSISASSEIAINWRGAKDAFKSL
jgi:hypothetical protein